ncbi:MAG: hypothetical protein KDA30_06710 [Phycisphaerales bacterium]|nr:hypothetical protein [Phycisphaerales bacterium]
MCKDDPKRGPKPGPDPERLKIDGDWKDAVKESLKKKRPEGGWPDQKPDEDKPETTADQR